MSLKGAHESYKFVSENHKMFNVYLIRSDCKNTIGGGGGGVGVNLRKVPI